MTSRVPDPATAAYQLPPAGTPAPEHVQLFSGPTFLEISDPGGPRCRRCKTATLEVLVLRSHDRNPHDPWAASADSSTYRDKVVVHADGTGPCDPADAQVQVDPRCDACGGYDLAAGVEAYHDTTTCRTCGHISRYSIGD